MIDMERGNTEAGEEDSAWYVHLANEDFGGTSVEVTLTDIENDIVGEVTGCLEQRGKMAIMSANDDDDMAVKEVNVLSAEDKRRKYEQLIDDVREYYERRSETDGPSFPFSWCESCKDEINLWTYWQGRGNLSPDVLVVGQDWGRADKDDPCIKNIEAKPERFYFEDVEHSRFSTDRNLAELIHELDNEWRPLERRCGELFFTNFILGYRIGKSTGGDVLKWVTPQVEDHFKRLIAILEPKVILCLGKATYFAAVKSLTGKTPARRMWAEVAGGAPIEVAFGKWIYPIFPLNHPSHNGAMSIRNRDRKGCEGKTDLELLGEGWGKIPAYLKMERKPNCD